MEIRIAVMCAEVMLFLRACVRYYISARDFCTSDRLFSILHNKLSLARLWHIVSRPPRMDSKVDSRIVCNIREFREELSAKLNERLRNIEEEQGGKTLRVI